MFVIKFDNLGSVAWARRIGGPSWEFANGMAADNAGSVFLAGQSQSLTTSFGSIVLTNYATMFFARIGFPSPLLRAVLTSNQNVLLSWSSVTGLTYQLQTSSNLSSASWSDFGSPVLASNSLTTASDSLLPTQVQKFYRVHLQP